MKKYLHYGLLVLACGTLMLAACNQQAPACCCPDSSSEGEPEPGPGPEPEPIPEDEYQLPESLEEAKIMTFDDKVAFPASQEDQYLIYEAALKVTGMTAYEEYMTPLPADEVSASEFHFSEYQLYKNEFYVSGYMSGANGNMSGIKAKLYNDVIISDAGYVEQGSDEKFYAVTRQSVLDVATLGTYTTWSLSEAPDYDNGIPKSFYASGLYDALGQTIFANYIKPNLYINLVDSYLLIQIESHYSVEEVHQYGDNSAPTFWHRKTQRDQIIYEMSYDNEMLSYYHYNEEVSDHDESGRLLVGEERKLDASLTTLSLSSDPLTDYSDEASFKASVPMYTTTFVSMKMDIKNVTAYDPDTPDSLVVDTVDANDQHITKTESNPGPNNTMIFNYNQSDLAKGTGYKAIQFSMDTKSVCLKGTNIGKEVSYNPVGIANENVKCFTGSEIVYINAQHYLLVPLAQLDDYYDIYVTVQGVSENGQPQVVMATLQRGE